MPVQSRIASLEEDEDYPLSDYCDSWSPSSPAHTKTRFSFDGHSHTHSGAMSLYDQRSHIPGSAPGNTRSHHAHTLSQPPSNSQRRSHISISSDDTNAEVTEIRLRNENYKLKLENQRLQGRLYALSYVPISSYIIHTH